MVKKTLFDIYADLECIIERIDGCKNNPENSYTTKASKHILSNFSTSTISSFGSTESKDNIYRGKDSMINSCEFLREHAKKIILKRKKMKLLAK